MALSEEMKKALSAKRYDDAAALLGSRQAAGLHTREQDAIASLNAARAWSVDDIGAGENLMDRMASVLLDGLLVPEPDGETGIAVSPGRCVKCDNRIGRGEQVRYDVTRENIWCTRCFTVPAEPVIEPDWERRITVLPDWAPSGPHPLPALVYHGTDGTLYRLYVAHASEVWDDVMDPRERALAKALLDLAIDEAP